MQSGQGQAQSGGVAQAATQPTPEEVLWAFRAAREELAEQLESLEDRREDITQQLQQAPTEAGRRGLEQRLADIDQRILAIEQQLADADLAVAQAAAVPGAVPPPMPEMLPPIRPPSFANPPEEYVLLGGMFMVLVLFPLAIAYARRLWKRGAHVVTSLPSNLMDRFARLEQSVEAIAIEVERIGEGQRFMTRVFARQASPEDQVPASLTDELELPPTRR